MLSAVTALAVLVIIYQALHGRRRCNAVAAAAAVAIAIVIAIVNVFVSANVNVIVGTMISVKTIAQHRYFACHMSFSVHAMDPNNVCCGMHMLLLKLACRMYV